MRLVNLFKIMCMAIVISLVYINMQMRIIDLAYQGKQKENQIRRLIEENGNLTYAILTLKSSHNLGLKMLDDEYGMEFVDPDNVLQISTPILEDTSDKDTRQIAAKEKTNPILNIISFGTEAQAYGLGQ